MNKMIRILKITLLGILLSSNTYAETKFQYAYRILLAHEGNYANHPDDKGGETYRGITKKYNIDWYGWRYVDRKRAKEQNQEIPQANFWAQDHYLTIWVREGFDQIHDWRLAAYLFDYRVNAFTGPKEIRKILNEIGCCIPIYNKFDDELAACVNSAPNWLLKNRLEYYRAQHYKRLAYKDQTQRKFLSHWLKRTKFANY